MLPDRAFAQSEGRERLLLVHRLTATMPRHLGAGEQLVVRRIADFFERKRVRRGYTCGR
jgi:hypothetical protein